MINMYGIKMQYASLSETIHQKIHFFFTCENFECEKMLMLLFLQGGALQNIKKVALLLLEHFPQHTLFNVFTFGSGLWEMTTMQGMSMCESLVVFDSAFPSSVPFDNKTAETAQDFILVGS